jgi:hypothetical protein
MAMTGPGAGAPGTQPIFEPADNTGVGKDPQATL